MVKISTSKELKNVISLLEEKQALQGQLLKKRLLYISDEMRPSNIVKNLLSKVTASPDLKGGLITTAIGLATFYLTRKTLWRAGRNPLKKVLYSLLQLGVSNIIAKNPEAIKSISHVLFGGIFRKKKKDDLKRPGQETC